MSNNSLKLSTILLILSIPNILVFADLFVLGLDCGIICHSVTQTSALLNWYYNHPFVFVLTYALIAVFSFPITTILTLCAGGLFGFSTGLIIASFTSTIVATCIFILARFVFKDYIQQRYKKHIIKTNEKFQQEGIFYLFTLRLAPTYSFFMTNILLSSTPITTRTFYFVSQLSMLPRIVMYVYTGVVLSEIQSFSPYSLHPLKLFFALVLIILFPIIAKKAITILRRHRKINHSKFS